MCEEIIFPLVGQINIGYNYMRHLRENDIKVSMDIRQPCDVGKKYQFPLTINASVPVGLYEIVFENRSHFTYKTNDMEEIHQAQHSSFVNFSRTDSFFLRRKNWIKVVEDSDGLPKQLRKAIL